MDGVIGHEAILRELRALAATGPPAHALLFAGPASTGRMALARYYAALVNCERAGDEGAEVPCGSCRACRLTAEGSHPDVVVLAPGDGLCRPRPGEASHAAHPDSRDIRICQVRGMIELVARYPFEARYRLIIIDPAERMTPDAANSLLKTLEEPPAHSLFLLLSSAPEQLLETVVSRCRRIDVTTVPTKVIETALRERGVEPNLAAEAAAAARGKPGLALAFAAKPDLMGDRDRILQRCARLAAAPLGERFRYTQELDDRWRRRDRETVFRELQLWEEFWERDLSRRADDSDEIGAKEALEALKVVALGREYLLSNCQARSVFDFMLAGFPRRTLDESGSEPQQHHDQ